LFGGEKAENEDRRISAGRVTNSAYIFQYHFGRRGSFTPQMGRAGEEGDGCERTGVCGLPATRDGKRRCTSAEQVSHIVYAPVIS